LLTATNPAGHPTQDLEASSHHELAGQVLQALSLASQKLGAAQATQRLSAVMKALSGGHMHLSSVGSST
jgi:hypothetical protein